MFILLIFVISVRIRNINNTYYVRSIRNINVATYTEY